MDEIKIYIVRDVYRGKYVFKDHSPGGSSRWGNVVSVDDIREADYLLISDGPPPPQTMKHFNFPPERIIYLKGEPTEFHFAQHYYDNVHPASHVYKDGSCGKYGTIWSIKKSYDFLKSMVDFPEKTKNLSAVVSNLGDGTQGPGIQILEGHQLRWNFLVRFLNKYSNQVDWYGKRIEKYITVPCNKGRLQDKWDGIKDYRYTFGFENSSEKGYFTEKISDAVLAGCMVFYWGCPDLEDYFPKDSFIRLDITKEDAPDKVIEMIHTDFRERHLNELKKAKELILDKYGLWPTICRIVNEVHNKQAN